MKTNILHAIKLTFSVYCLISCGISYSQNKKTTGKTVFGKTVKAASANPKDGKIRCATVEYEQFLQEKNPARMSNAQFENWLLPLVAKQKSIQDNSKTAGTVITIPVVVHVIHSGEAIGVAPNITDAQVKSQIKVLNEDYRKMLGTPGYNSNPVGADVEIQFELAKQDPNGNPTNGINRVNLGQPSWADTDIDTTVKPSTIWNPSFYMNMWSIAFTDNTLLGYAQFPNASGLPGLDSSGGTSNTDGVVSNYTVFGSIAYNDGTFLLDRTYNKGRTMSHEVGHWLGLLHIWGDSDCGDDYCADTPVHNDANYGCPTVVNCDETGNEMVENYMDYTDDACMNIFTKNQKDRITTIINNAARRKSLITSTKTVAIPLFANDAEIKLEASVPKVFCGFVANQTKQIITIINRGTTNLTAAKLNYKINSGSNSTYNWTGNLATNERNSFEITINSASNGTISANVVTANGVTDQRTTNDAATGTFTIPVTPLNYTHSNYTFRLQQDLWGSETTWSLKDGSGTILYSGGPYTDKKTLPAIITQNWSLANNQCYTFTINDGVGDGICCDGGNGYYDIKTNGDATIVKSGSTFTSREITTFTTNTLGTDTFEALNAIYLYPNPTKDIININVPSDFGLPNNISINNNLGQIISRKEVSKESDLSINTSSLSKGVYFITVTKENQSKTLQFIKE